MRADRTVIVFGAFLFVIGLAVAWNGYGYVSLERGWSLVISGTIAFCAGLVLVALGLVLRELRAIAHSADRATLLLAKAKMAQPVEPPPAPVAAPEPEFETSDEGWTPPAEPETAEPPATPGKRDWVSRLRLPRVDEAADGLSGAGGRNALAWMSRPADVPPSLAKTAPEQPEPPQASLAEIRDESPAPQTPEHFDPVDTTPVANAEQPAEESPTRAIEAETRRQEFVPEPEPLRDPEAHSAPAPEIEIVSKEVVQTEAPREIPVDENPAGEKVLPGASEPEPESQAAEPEPTPATEAAEKPAIIGHYDANGAHYTMYADGSIEAETAHGVYRFASMEELKRFIDSQQ